MGKEILFSVVCPTCEAKIGVHDPRLVGQLVNCPKCGSIVQLVKPEEQTSTDIQSVVQPPVSSSPIPEPMSAESKASQPTSPEPKIPQPESQPTSIPVPPLIAPPIAPPKVAEPTTDSIPEPIAPEPLNPNASTGNKKPIFQTLSELLDKLPTWTPYAVIAIGIIALIALLSVFVFSGKTETKENPLVTENRSEKQEVRGEKEPLATENRSEKREARSEKEPVGTQEESTPKVDNSSPEEPTPVTEDRSENEPPAIQEEPTPETDKSVSEEAPLATRNSQLATQEEPTPETDKSVPEEAPLATDNSQLATQPNTDVVLAFPPEEQVSEEPTPESDKFATQEEPTSEEEAPLATRNSQLATQDKPATQEEPTSEEETSLATRNSQLATQDKPATPPIPGLITPIKSISIQNQTFTQTLQLLKELGALPIEPNWKMLAQMGVKPEDKIIYQEKDVTVEKILKAVLQQRGLRYKVTKDKKITFVPLSSLNERSTTEMTQTGNKRGALLKRTYNVSDVVGNAQAPTEELIKLICDYLCPGDWKQTGGQGTITASSGGTLVIMQSEPNHWIIADFLDRLRLARHLAPVINTEVTLEPMSVRAQSTLNRNVGINFESSVGLKKALADISSRIGVKLLLDEPALKSAGILPMFPVTLNAQSLTLAEFFQRLKEETKLVYQAQTPTSFIVTTEDGLKSIQSVEFYPIDDLISMGVTAPVLITQIQKFMPTTWKSQDPAGVGLIDFDSRSDCLIVRQTSVVHDKITKLLAKLRENLKKQSK